MFVPNRKIVLYKSTIFILYISEILFTKTVLHIALKIMLFYIVTKDFM